MSVAEQNERVEKEFDRNPNAQPRKPSGRQWWRIAHEALALLDVDAPETRKDASELIDRLLATNGVKAPESAPF